MKVPVHGSILGDPEREALRAVVDRLWLTAGPEAHKFEKALRDYTGARDVTLVNSGSSANLIAIMALAQKELGSNAIMPGDEVITAAVGFPTTVNPILQAGAIPVMVDVELPSLVPSLDAISAAITPKTKAIVLAHTLGYPLPMRELRETADECNLWLVEDACDALGSPGTFEHSHIGTISFYPAHQITTGEGGAALTRSPTLGKIMRSLRDWGRACWCEPGADNTCGKRHDGAYDHKYTYDRIGYHLAMTDPQAAIGAVQMARLPELVKARDYNHAYLSARMSAAGMGDHFMIAPNLTASWFGYALICREHVHRSDLIRFLESKGIQTRLIFGGNLTRQPAYQGANIRVVGSLANADIVHERAFWVGCWPGLSEAQLNYTADAIIEYCRRISR